MTGFALLLNRSFAVPYAPEATLLLWSFKIRERAERAKRQRIPSIAGEGGPGRGSRRPVKTNPIYEYDASRVSGFQCLRLSPPLSLSLAPSLPLSLCLLSLSVRPRLSLSETAAALGG